MEAGHKDNWTFLRGDTLHVFSVGKPQGLRSTGCPSSLLEADIVRNNNWLPGGSGMRGYEWAFAPFVQMERAFLRDIIFRLFFCLAGSHLRPEVGMFYWGRDICLLSGCSSHLSATGLHNDKCGPDLLADLLHCFLVVTGTVLIMNKFMGTTTSLPSVGQLCPLTYRVICGNLAGFLLPCVYAGFSSGLMYHMLIFLHAVFPLPSCKLTCGHSTQVTAGRQLLWPRLSASLPQSFCTWELAQL